MEAKGQPEGRDGAAWDGEAVLVTGAGGFIGRRLVRRLAELGARVHGCGRREPPSGLPLAGWTRTDLAADGAADAVLAAARPAVVFHLASHVSGARGPEAVLPTFESNLGAAVRLLLAVTAAASGPAPCRRLVLAGSLEEPAAPDAVPASPYAAAKGAASAYARMFHALYGTPVVLARLFMVYGPEQQDESKLVPHVVRSLLAGEAPRLSSGTRPVDWIYVDDVVAGLLAAAAAPGVEGETFDLGTGELVTVRAVVERLAAAVGGDAEPAFGALPDRPRERVRRADPGPSGERLGWRPSTSLEEGLARTVAWYREAPSGPHRGSTM